MVKRLRSLGLLSRRTLSGAIAVLLAANGLVTLRHAQVNPTNTAGLRLIDEIGGRQGALDPNTPLAAGGTKSPAAVKALPGGGNVVKKSKLIGKFIPGLGTLAPGITDSQVKVVYYWKGDQTMSSQFVNGTSAEGHDLDEANAFRTLVKYLNMHKDGGATFMGFPFNLHGRELVPYVEEAGKSSDTYNAMLQKINGEIKPFAAISSHGSLSTEICPQLALKGVHNFSTYDLGGLGGTMQQRTNGYCLPAGISFEQQIDLMVNYILHRTDATTFDRPGSSNKRVYGFLYAEYRGLIDVAPKIVARLRAAGLNIPKNGGVQSMPGDLTTGQTVAANTASKFAAAGVNTIISPDSGALLTFTRGAQQNGNDFDYVIWPCSGQDSTGMVRLYDNLQWRHAKGLTCYDPEFNADITKSDNDPNTEWYKQYQEAAPGKAPPAPTPLIYQGLLPLVVGLTNGTQAGKQVTIEGFRAGLNTFKPYRYSATQGKTTNPENMLITLNDGDRSCVGDVAELFWDPLKGTKGEYHYTEHVRYKRGAVF